jgi:L-lactate dehydrogenase complex protein LldG
MDEGERLASCERKELSSNVDEGVVTMGSDARAAILARVRQASDSGPITAPLYGHDLSRLAQGDPALFVKRLSDYQAFVQRLRPDEIGRVIAQRLTERDARRVVVPGGFPEGYLRDAGVTRVRDTPLLTPWELNELDGVVTLCTVAIAETGTIILTHGAGQGRRALTLVPDYLLIVVREDQIVQGVPDAVTLLQPRGLMTWISGPSATSDIELRRVEGVHGPRHLEVLVVETGATARRDTATRHFLES